MKPKPQIGDIWCWKVTSWDSPPQYTWVLLVEHEPLHTEAAPRFIGMQISTTDPEWINASGTCDPWSFEEETLSKWEFIA